MRRLFPPAFAAVALLFLMSPAARASFQPTEGKYQIEPGHHRHLVFHYAGHRVFNVTFHGTTVAHATYHTGDHSFTVTTSSWSIDGRWTNERTVHGHYTLGRDKTSFVAHIHAPPGS